MAAPWVEGAWAPNAWLGTAWAISSGSPGDPEYLGFRQPVFALSSVAGLVQWVDYLPVRVISPSDGCAGRYDEDGCWPVEALASVTGLSAWVDYIPVFAVADSPNKWRYENDGWIPVDTLTP